ncbi:MAG: ribosome silencing factor [Ruminococcaceae bacterium]|nr:ribosome silencing factor [Oscillospiraceae bacterium]
MEMKELSPREIAEIAVKALDSKRAKDIKLLYVEKQTVLADYYVLATGNSNTQINALSGEVEHKLTEAGVAVSHIEGYGNGTWVLMDYGTVAVHIFSREARDFYNLDKLWSDSEQIDITPIVTAEDKEDNKD